MTDKKIISITLDAAGKRRLEAIVDRFDMKQKAAMGRILLWFTQQDHMVQSLVLGHIPDEYVAGVVDLMHQRLHQAPDLQAEDAARVVERSLAESGGQPRRRDSAPKRKRKRPKGVA